MTTDRIAALEALLAETEAAHGVFETTELHGLYDSDWPHWYAEYALAHGIGILLSHPVTADALASYLESSWADLQRADPKPTDQWSAYTARHLAADL